MELAARNNADWCDLVCRAHGLPTSFDPTMWVTARRSPPFYPDAVTLHPGVRAEDLLARVDTSAGCSVKDSFAVLDLTGHGFQVLFTAEWIHRPPVTGPVTTWKQVDGPVDDPAVAYLAGPDGSTVVANRSATVVGLSNLVAGDNDPDQVWAEATAAVSARFPGLPVVGYERDADLDLAYRAGFTGVGPLRVWLKD